MAITDEERLRALIGESIPEGKDETATLFSDDDITDLLERWGSVEASLGEAWEQKAAILVNLVTTTEGSSTRKLSDMHKAAMAMVKLYGGGAGGESPGVPIGGAGITRVHRIVR
jgi:hypothetical protein